MQSCAESATLSAGDMTHVLQSGRASQPANKRQQLVKTHSSHLWDNVHNVLQFEASVLDFPLLCSGFDAAGRKIGMNPIRKLKVKLFQIQFVLFTHKQLDCESNLNLVWMEVQ